MTSELVPIGQNIVQAINGLKVAFVDHVPRRLYFDVRDYDPDGTDITFAIRLARDAAVAAGGGTIWIPKGTAWQVKDTTGSLETFTGGWTVGCKLNEGVAVEGGGEISFVTTTNNSALFGIVDPNSSTSYTLNANIILGDYQVTLTSTTGLAVGDLMEFAGNDSDGRFHYVVQRIFTVDSGTVISFSETFPIDFPTSATPSVTKKVFYDGTYGGLRDLTLKGDQALAANVMGIRIIGSRYLCLRDIIFEDWSGSTPVTGDSAGLLQFGGYQNSAFNLRAIGGGSGTSNALDFNWQSKLVVDNLIAEDCVEFGIGFGSCSDGQIGWLAVSAVSLGRPVKFASCVRCMCAGGRVSGSYATGWAISVGTKYCTFGHIICRGLPTATPGNAMGLWFSDQENKNNNVLWVDSDEFVDWAITVWDSDTGNIINGRFAGGSGTIPIYNAGAALINGGIIGKPAQTSVTNDNTSTADPTLVFNSVASVVYRFRFVVSFNTVAAADFKWELSGPAGINTIEFGWRAIAPDGVQTTGVGNALATSVSILSASSGVGQLEVTGIIYSGTAVGEVAFAWAQDTSDAGATLVRAGSYCECAATG